MKEIVHNNKKFKIVYCTPALYMAGGVERVLTLKANYFAEQLGYDITIILTEGKDRPFFYNLSERVRVINLDLGFEELWHCSFMRKVWLYLRKQYQFKKRLTNELLSLKPDITISLLRREINFITSIHDGSKKIGELHINRANYRNFNDRDTNFLKSIFAKFWMRNLVGKLKQLDRLVVLTETDKEAWVELNNVVSIPNPLSINPKPICSKKEKRVIAVGRYCQEKGYDALLQVWAKIQNVCEDWSLVVFGDGDKTVYEQIIDDIHVDRNRCVLNGPTNDIQSEFENSSLAVCCSRFEGFGLAIAEAMACGLPVVSFDCPWGPREIINNEEDGILVENGNIDMMVQRLVQLLQDSNYRNIMGKNARRNIERFEISKIASQWKTLFEELN